MANSLEKRKYFFIYKTTNLVNGKYYVGMHSTSNLKDGYIGSGTVLRRAIRKYGKQNFKCEILEFCEDHECLVQREIEIVDSPLLKDPLCMNLKPGGKGGFKDKEHQRKCAEAGRSRKSKIKKVKTLRNRIKSDPEFAEQYRLRSTKNLGVYKGREGTFKGRKHTEESKVLMRKAKEGKYRGKNSPQFYTCWITNGTENKKIKRDELGQYLLQNWRRGRRM